MIEKILDIPTRDGAMETFICHPERGGPYPPVLFLMDAPGIREELRHGMPPKTAIQHGYERAGGTIMDANLTGLIVGIALYVFGTGPLKGFALTMIIGIFASMFTAITVSRAIATLLYGRRKHLKTVAI